MILYINTKDQKQVTVSLKENGKVVENLSEQNKFGSQVLLPLIVKLLNEVPTSSGAQIQNRTKLIKNSQVSIQFHPKGGNSLLC